MISYRKESFDDPCGNPWWIFKIECDGEVIHTELQEGIYSEPFFTDFEEKYMRLGQRYWLDHERENIEHYYG